MKYKNAKIFINGKFLDGGIEFEEKIITAGPDAGKDGEDLHGSLIIPGLIDIHTHGAMDADASDGDPEGLIRMSEYYAREGVTSWCPTTMTLKEEDLVPAMTAVRNFRRPKNGAKIAGIHMEGPFVSMAKRGAQNAENIHKPDAGLFKRLNKLSGNQVKIITMAPEEPGGIEAIREISKECLVSVGHTTASYEEALSAYKAGAGHLTHLFNAMPSLLHREPGTIPAALESGASAEIITDGIHVHPAIIRIAYDLFKERLILISDSLRCAGMPDGDYTLGGQPITMKNGKATLKDSDTIAGSSIHLMEGVRRAASFGLGLEAAVFAASTAPARAIGMADTIGSIAPGLAADLVVLDKELRVLDVYVEGVNIG